MIYSRIQRLFTLSFLPVLSFSVNVRPFFLGMGLERLKRGEREASTRRVQVEGKSPRGCPIPLITVFCRGRGDIRLNNNP